MPPETALDKYPTKSQANLALKFGILKFEIQSVKTDTEDAV